MNKRQVYGRVGKQYKSENMGCEGSFYEHCASSILPIIPQFTEGKYHIIKNMIIEEGYQNEGFVFTELNELLRVEFYIRKFNKTCYFDLLDTEIKELSHIGLRKHIKNIFEEMYYEASRI